MKYTAAILGILFCYAGAANAVPARVDYIIDGDTFGATVLLKDDISVKTRVRIMNIDSPEIHGECDTEIKQAFLAKDRLAELIPIGVLVDLTGIKDDKYLGRIDAFVSDGLDRDIGKIMIKEDLARAYSGGRRQGWCN